MKSASKSTLSLNNLKILWPKVRKNLKNLPKKFFESLARAIIMLIWLHLIIFLMTFALFYFKKRQGDISCGNNLRWIWPKFY